MLVSRTRLTIRTLLALVAVSGLFLAFARSFASILAMPLFLATHTMVGWVFSLVLGFGLSQAIGWRARTPRGKACLAIVLVLTVVATGYLAWAFHRAETYSSAINDEAFPYPDPMINGSERWLDAQRPLPPGRDALKIHGEYPLVTLILGTSVVVLMASLGLILGTLVGAGLVFARPDPGGNPSSRENRPRQAD